MPYDPERPSAGWRDIGAGFLLSAAILVGMVVFGDAGTDIDPLALRAADPPIVSRQLADDEQEDDAWGLYDDWRPDEPPTYQVMTPVTSSRARLYCRGELPAAFFNVRLEDYAHS
ncbi:hypothetical protein [Ancylobacter defluvii]|uniref:Uncharacterized protein n=1 Tax=Ancylobacter defluvii TaxID=1282440 RepID=A0A9W6N9H9_9HYPH|nr:hypothetical protein [Ancylobacter defluvii]MBS7587627.1 hypothetical protein [Ancylobacter defluvii]GLK82437.1 hypothetical protein GCM10017653_05060 [Ancylobacter defluvii]